MISVVDPDARHAHKTVHRRQDGFKAHIAVEPDTGLVTDCRLTKASGPVSGDAAVGPTLLDSEPAPVQVLADSAYGSGQARAELRDAGHQVVIKPIPLRPAVEDGFTVDDFTVDHTAATVTCPNRIVRTITSKRNVVFGRACRGCPLQHQCTTSKAGRSLNLHEHEDLLRSCPPASRNTRVPSRLPSAPADGRTLHRLAGTRQPSSVWDSPNGPGIMSFPAQGSAFSTLAKTPASEINGIDWLAQQNGGQFDPVLFGDYREPQEAITSGDYDTFFNEAFPLPDLNSPFNDNLAAGLELDGTKGESRREAERRQGRLEQAAGDAHVQTDLVSRKLRLRSG